MSRATDNVLAEVLEQLAGARDASDACALVLERALAEAGLERGIAFLRFGSELRGAGIALPERIISSFFSSAADGESPVYLDFYATSGWKQKSVIVASFLGLTQATLVPVGSSRTTAVGAVILEAAPTDESVALVTEIFRRCASALARC